MKGIHKGLIQGLRQVRVVELESYLKSFYGKKGEVIYRDGETPPALYFIDHGYVELHHSSLESESLSELRAFRGPGEYFGEMALIDRRKRHMTVTVTDDVRGRYLSQASFDRIIADEPKFLINLTQDVLLRTTEHDSELIRELFRAKTAAETFIRRLKALGSTSETINSTLDLDDLLDIILQQAIKHTNADRGTIYIVTEDGNSICSKVLDGEVEKEICLPIGSGIAGYVAETGEVLNIQDAYSDDRFNPQVDKDSGYKTRSLLTMPMKNPGGDVVGVIQLLNKDESINEGIFDRNDEEFIASMGVQGSIAIEKARMAEHMVKNESLAAVGRLASGIIHDFKNPMTVIRGYAQLLEMPLEENERKDYLNIILGQIDRLVGMTQEVLDFSRGKTELKLNECLVSPFIQELCSTIARDYKEQNVDVVMALPENDIEATFDEDRFTRVFFNLVGNARDAMPGGGTLSITLEENNGGWRLQIADTGTGIPEDRIEEIFQPFATFEKSHGTGLGLAIVKSVIEAHNGSLEVESEVGKGTIFTISMPLTPFE